MTIDNHPMQGSPTERMPWVNAVGSEEILADAAPDDPLQEQPMQGIDNLEPPQGSIISRAYNYGTHALRTAIIVSELTPLNEVARYGALAASLAETRNPIVSAAVLGGTTLAIEGAAAVAAAEYVAQNKAAQVIQGIGDRLPDKPWLRRFFQPKQLGDEAGVSRLAEAGIALNLGVVASMQAHQGMATGREVGEVRAHGLKTAGFLAGALAVEGALIAEGIDNADSPWVWGAGVALLGAAVARKGIHKVKNYFTSEQTVEQTQEISQPRYDLSKEELAQLESSLVSQIKESHGDGVIVPVLISPESRFANIVRTYEAEYFPEVKELPAEVESNTVFLALVDTRDGIDRVVHATTLSGFDIDGAPNTEADVAEEQSTGFIVTDDLVSMGNFTPAEFKEYYISRGYDLQKCLSVETNFIVGERPPLFNGLRTADVAYLAVFQMFMTRNPEVGRAAIFSSINHASTQSFARVGVQCLPLMGRNDLVTSESMQGLEYKPVAIPYNDTSRHLFDNIAALNLDPVKV